MSDNEPTVLEIDVLKKRADQLGVEYSNNIGVDTLRKRITNKLEGITDDESEDQVKTVKPKTTLIEARKSLQDEYLQLKRIRISNMNPSKTELPGEILTVANDILGTFRKFIPYTGTEDGYHVPKWVYLELKSRKFQQIRSVKDPRTKQEHMVIRMVPEFNIELLPALTPKELARLASDQRAEGSE